MGLREIFFHIFCTLAGTKPTMNQESLSWLISFACNLFDVLKIVAITLILSIYHGIIALIPVKYFTKKSVRGNVVLVTGSGNGIGRLLAQKMSLLGAKIVVWDVDERAANETVKLIKDNAPTAEAWAYTCDLSDKDAVYQTAKRVQNDAGDVDILINNAGIVTGKNLLDCPDYAIIKTMQVNCLAHFWTVRAFLPKMMERNFGHIVTMSSGAGLIAVNGLTDYCASKYAAVGFHESLALELDTLGYKNIHTTLVCPYYMNTGMFDGVTTKFPLTLPIMEPDHATDRIMDAILINQKMLAIPRLIYLFIFLKALLPVTVSFYLGHSMEVTKSMVNFKGRSKNGT